MRHGRRCRQQAWGRRSLRGSGLWLRRGPLRAKCGFTLSKARKGRGPGESVFRFSRQKQEELCLSSACDVHELGSLPHFSTWERGVGLVDACKPLPSKWFSEKYYAWPRRPHDMKLESWACSADAESTRETVSGTPAIRSETLACLVAAAKQNHAAVVRQRNSRSAHGAHLRWRARRGRRND